MDTNAFFRADLDRLFRPQAPKVETGRELARTLEWHQAVHKASVERFGEKTPDERLQLALLLIREEVAELFLEVYDYDRGEPRSVASVDRAAAAKEAADLFFVVLQLMYVLGVPFEAAYNEVLRSNWSKLDGGVRFRDDGKLLKSDAYSPANIAPLLEG